MKINFSKRALAVVMAVLMIMSSATAFAFAANKVNPAIENQKVVDKLNATTLETVNTWDAACLKQGLFGKDNPNASKAEVYNNLLFANKVKNDTSDNPHGADSNFVSSIRIGGKVLHSNFEAHLFYPRNAVLLYDGVKAPSIPVLLSAKAHNHGAMDTKLWSFYIDDKTGLSLEGDKWHGYEDGNKWGVQNFNGVYDNGAENVETKEGTDNDGAFTIVSLSSNKYTALLASAIEFSGSFAEGEYYRSAQPTFRYWVGNSQGNNNGTGGTAVQVYPVAKITIVNYKAVADALETLKTKAATVSHDLGNYTVSSIAELNGIVELIKEANPNNFDFSTTMYGGKGETDNTEALDAFAAAAKKAVDAANAWQPILAKAENINVTNQSFVVDYDANVKYNLNDNAKQADDASVNYVGYTTSAPSATNEIVIPSRETYTSFKKDVKVPLKNGTATIKANGDIVYKIDKSLEFSTPDTLYVLAEIATNSTTPNLGYKWEKITFIPANSIYVEDDSPVFKMNGSWENADKAANKVADQAANAVGSKEIYGNDANLANNEKYSAGNAKVVKVTKETNKDFFQTHNADTSVEFTFTGTGFDVISLASNNTGKFVVEVYQGQKRLMGKFVNTYNNLKYVDGAWVEAKPGEAADSLYQIPAIKINNLAYGTYRVVIVPVYSASEANAGKASCEFVFDGVRIYNPTNDATAQDAYNKDGQANAKYGEVRQLIRPDTAFSSTYTNGIILSDKLGSIATAPIIAEANRISPNHEFYLPAGQQIQFEIKGAKPSSVQIGAKKVTGSGAAGLNGTAINTTTDMYYSLTRRDDSLGVYVVENTGDAVLSLTNIKCTFNTAAAASTFAIVANKETPKKALALRNAPTADLAVKANAPVVTDKTVTITAVTSLDVEKLNVMDVNGNAVDAKITCTVNGDVKNWTVVITENAAGTYTYVLEGEYAYGLTNASASDDVTVTIEEAAAPAPELTFGQKIVNFFKKIFGIKF